LLPRACAAAYVYRLDLVDHLISTREQVRWYFDAERLRGLKIDDHLKFGWLDDRKVGRLGTVENPGNLRAGGAVVVGNVSVANQTATSHELTKFVNCGKLVSLSQRH
jgi:hypothetical protein